MSHALVCDPLKHFRIEKMCTNIKGISNAAPSPSLLKDHYECYDCCSQLSEMCPLVREGKRLFLNPPIHPTDLGLVYPTSMFILLQYE